MASLNKAFREIGRVHTSRSAFNLKFNNLSTHEMGKLYPVFCKYTMPGDKWRIDVESIVRAMPLEYPAYVDITATYHFYFVPYRLLWDQFEDFITGGEDGDFKEMIPKIFDVIPGVESYHNNSSSKSAYISTIDCLEKRLGLVGYNAFNVPIWSRPTAGSGTPVYSFPRDLLPTCLPDRAYYFIWNEYYRDQNLMSKILFKNVVYCGDVRRAVAGSFSSSFLKDPSKTFPVDADGLCYVSWLKDYFTASLPFQQRGTAPVIPFSGSLELSDDVDPNSTLAIGSISNLIAQTPGSNRYLGTDRNAWASGNVLAFDSYINTSNNLVVTPRNQSTDGQPLNLQITAKSLAQNLLRDLKLNVWSGLTMSDLRVAAQVQKYFERNARAGSRYTEYLQAHYNVSPSDARLDRPEFLGGAKFPIVISDVMQTGGETSSIGNYSGKAVGANIDKHTVDYFVEEHGVIIGLFFIRPKTQYFQGFNREFQYSTNLEFPSPEFMHLSEQGITNSEIYVASSSVTFDPSGIFGYTGIYDELRWSRSVVSGHMALSQYETGYSPWHMARRFSSDNPPKLNSGFVTCNPSMSPFKVTDSSTTPPFIVDHTFPITCVRPMPIIGEPGLVDHF